MQNICTFKTKLAIKIINAFNFREASQICYGVIFFKATVSFRKDWLGLPCLAQLVSWLHVSDYRNFWNTEIR